ncbi:HD domain-containing protein [Furfurilactobacillus sp. WILCCON 0119]|uniref:HD domain-containing protein n=1 Tax=Furfurilactobacillus entadae TaxID=2922307 RepID=UPI0038B3CFAE
MTIGLSAGEQEQLVKIIDYARGQLGAEHSGHDFEHVERVAKLAARIESVEQTGQPFIVIATAYLHDVMDDKVVADPNAARQALHDRLTTWGVSGAQITAMFAIIDHMSFSANLAGHQSLSAAGQIVQDADRMDAIGAIGIARTLTYGGHHDRVIYDPDIAPRTQMTKADYRNDEGTTINHFYEKLLLIKDQLNTATARQLADHRQQVMLNFLDEFKQEWNGEA